MNERDSRGIEDPGPRDDPEREPDEPWARERREGDVLPEWLEELREDEE